MNRTIADSKGYDVVCMSFGKELEKGIKVVKAGKKDTFIEAESKELKTGKSKLYENNKLEEETGNIIVNFAEYKQAKYNNENRPTEYSLEMAEENGIIKSFMKEQAKREGKLVEFEEENKRRTKIDSEQVI